MENHTLDGVEFLCVVDHDSVAKYLSEFVGVVRDGWQGFDVNLVRVPTSVEFSVFEILSNVVRGSLVRHAVVFHEHPEVDVAPSIGVSAGDTTVQDNADDAIKPIE